MQTLELVDLTSEMARRETLIAPVLLEVCTQTGQPLKIEYAVNVNQWLQGRLLRCCTGQFQRGTRGSLAALSVQPGCYGKTLAFMQFLRI